MLKPKAAIPAKAPIIVTGTVVAGTNVARQSWRKSMITRSTRKPASKIVFQTSLIDSLTKRVVSNGMS